MSPFTPRELLDLVARQEVEGVDLVARILSLTPGPSPRGQGEEALTPGHSPRGREEDALTPDPSTGGRREIERRIWMQTLRTRPALLVLILVLALALVSGAAYALGRSLGYLPGVGLIEQGAPIRVLAEPVSQTREGITLTVQEAVLTSERTVVVLTLENVPLQTLPHQEEMMGCDVEPQLRMPDGETLAITAGRGSGDAQGRLELRWSYAPIPPNVNEAEFFVPCIQGTLPGQAPENWTFKLRFVPAPPDLTVLPVQEMPTPVPATPANPSDQPPQGWQIEKVIETAQGYILVGTFRLSDLPYNAMVLGFSKWPTVIDALGNEVTAQPASDLDVSSSIPGEIPWGIEIFGKQQAWPLTLRVGSIDVQSLDLSAEFTWDVGQNPTEGQEWPINQTVQLGEWQIEVQHIRFTGKGYEIKLHAPDPIKSISVEPETGDIYPNSGYGNSDGEGNILVGFEYENPPFGKIKVRFSGVIFSVRGNWTTQWTPDNAQGIQPLYGIRLVLDKTVELEDGYYLVGHLEWDEAQIDLAIPGTRIFALDAQGNRLNLEEVSFEILSQLVPNFSELPYQTWVYRLAGKDFRLPITLHLEKVNLGLTTPISLTLDLTPYGFAFDEAHNGLSYAVGPIALEGLPQVEAGLVGVSYLRQGDWHGFDLSFEADPRLSELYFQNGEEAVSETGKSLSSIGPSREAQGGLLVVRIMTDADLAMPLTLVVPSFQIRGDWTVEWSPPP